MYKYFTNVNTLDELKKEYRRLVMLHHPDRGGDTSTMQQINNEHDALFEVLKKQHNAKADKYHKTTETPEEFRAILEVLLKLDGLDIELCGSWLWIGGETKQHKDELKAALYILGFDNKGYLLAPGYSCYKYLKDTGLFTKPGILFLSP